LLSTLARALVAGRPAVDEVADRATRALGKQWRWIPPLAKRYVERFADNARPRRSEVVEFLLRDRGLQRAWAQSGDQLRIQDWLAAPPQMLPAPAAISWPIPQIASEGELAAWLDLTAGELEWFADLSRLGAKRSEEKLRHYRYRILAKDSASIRLIESPKPRLKQMQQIILAEILNAIPAHPAAHGFVRRRSIKTFAAPHVCQRIVLRMDLRDFFPSLHGGRVQALFRTAGYPERVADLLGGLCTTATPLDVWKQRGIAVNPILDPVLLHLARQRYAWTHLPQGAPTSPALANLCAYRFDCRLSGLARSADAAYTRYADDLAFSGGQAFERCADRFAVHAAAILLEEGFEVHHRKTRIMRRGVRQYLAGVVVNERVNAPRSDFDRLKATLTNCVRRGPASQNRDNHSDFLAHLTGRIAFTAMLNPQKAARLQKIFDQIKWPPKD
jgi:hypothetical protein